MNSVSAASGKFQHSHIMSCQEAVLEAVSNGPCATAARNGPIPRLLDRGRRPHKVRGGVGGRRSSKRLGRPWDSLPAENRQLRKLAASPHGAQSFFPNATY